MKKISIALISLCIGIFFASCSMVGPKEPKADLKTELDSLAYAIGLSTTSGLKIQLEQSGLDSTYLENFIKGLLEASSTADSQKIAYLLGLQYGQQFSDESFEQFNVRAFQNDSANYISKDQFMAGVIAGIRGLDTKIDPEAASNFVQTKMELIRAKAAEKQYAGNKVAGAQFLEENKKKEGIVTLPSGLQYKVIKEGTGAKPTISDQVKVHYKGTLIDGTPFDSSYDRNDPTVFGVNQVIAGWTEALQLMSVGSKWELYVPQELGYTNQDRGVIKPFSTLVFEMELLSIEAPAAPVEVAPVPQIQ